jgi:glycolate oxidase
MRAVKYGVTRDYIRALEVVLPNGKIVQAGSDIAKNSSSYSIRNLIMGPEGTLGIITGAVLRLLPLPTVAVSLLVPFPDLKSTIRIVQRS